MSNRFPAAFKKLARVVISDFSLLDTHPEMMVEGPLEGLSDAEKSDLKIFLDTLLAGKPSSRELKRIWLKANPDLHIPHARHARLLMLYLRAVLTCNPQKH